MHLRFDNSTTPEFAAVSGLSALTKEQLSDVAAAFNEKRVVGILEAKAEGGTLLLKPDTHILFEDTIRRVASQLKQLLPDEVIVFNHEDQLKAVKAFISCWPARTGS